VKTIYRVSTPNVFWIWVLGLLALGCAFGVVRGLIEINHTHDPPRDSRELFGPLVQRHLRVILICLGLGAVFGFMANRLAENRNLAQLVAQPPQQVAEGCVQVLHEQPSGGHARGDLIEVGGTEFEIDFYKIGPGYGRTISHGGLLRAGTAVRILHHDGIIVQIDTLPIACP
jgi:hypothetical protein